MKILYRLLVVILCFILPIYFICFGVPFIICGVIVNMFRYILVCKTYCLHVIFERYIDKLFKLVDYCNNK
jgi:hypothetical protein